MLLLTLLLCSDYASAYLRKYRLKGDDQSNCNEDTRCSSGVLIACKSDVGPSCRHRCPLGRYLKPHGAGQRRECAPVCPSGYHVDAFSRDMETCQPNALDCFPGQSVILEASAWHDTICGYPNAYVPPASLQDRIESKIFLWTLDRLALIWLRELSEQDTKRFCNFLPGVNQDTCRRNAEVALMGTNVPTSAYAEHIFYALNSISAFQAAVDMYRLVVKPFVGDLNPTSVSLDLMHANPLWVQPTRTLELKAKVHIPLGASNRYIPKTLTWYTNKALGTWAVKADGTNVMASNPRYNLSKGLDWTREDSRGFFVNTLDASMTVENFHCGLFNVLHLAITVYDKHLRVLTLLERKLDVNCMWKPPLHPSCNCARALLDYAKPEGLCSPACTTAPIPHVFQGLPGSNNDWTLEVSYKPRDLASFTDKGRVLFGSVTPNTQRFCVVTTEIFSLTPGPRRDSPTAPLDVRRCDIVLLEFQMFLERESPMSIRDSEYLRVPVRSLRHTAKTWELRIPSVVNVTLAHMTRQAWGREIGVKLKFVSSIGAVPSQEEMAAVLDWLSDVPLRRAIRVIVIDTDLKNAHVSDYSMINSVYRSRFELIPGFTASQLSYWMYQRGRESTPLTPGERRAESVLNNLGRLVLSQGAFLDLDRVSRISADDGSCNRVRPDIWRAGDYSDHDPYLIKLPREERHPELTGVFIFEELCRRSNNRAGIVVSIPSARYSLTHGCGSLTRMVNRHDRTNYGVTTIAYSMQELRDIVADMARWGVSRYSMGYLDFTFGHADNIPTFTELSIAINSAAATIRTLHYRYTRNSTFGNGGYAQVEGVYKLQGGMFFQRVTQSTPQVKSFFPVPGVPNLRLGLSSDMNVGAPLTMSELTLNPGIERARFVPYGARVVDLNHKATVAFVDQDRDTICIHSQATAIRSRGLRLPSFGIRNAVCAKTGNGSECYRHVNGARHHAKFAFRLPVDSEEYKRSILNSLSVANTRIDSSALSVDDREWLFANSVGNWSVRQTPPGLTGVLESMHLVSKAVECIRGSGSCMELGDYAYNGWPQGGTGYPIAIRGVELTRDDILVKMIILVNHGAARVKVACDLTPFSFGSEQPASRMITEGYHTQDQTRLLPTAIEYTSDVERFIAQVAHRFASLYRRDAVLGERHLSHGEYLQIARGCASDANQSLYDLRELFTSLGEVIEHNNETWRFTVRQLAFVGARTYALCLSATLLALLIDIALLATLCCAREAPRRNTFHYRKIQ